VAETIPQCAVWRSERDELGRDVVEGLGRVT
jgi:hypothetical protein